MMYIPSIRVGQNDIKALTNIETNRREHIIPLLNMRGDSQRHLDAFLSNWTDHPFFLDISPFAADSNDSYIVTNGLFDCQNSYANRQSFFRAISSSAPHMIPTVSWKSSDSPRETIQLALALERNNNRIAVRVDFSDQQKSNQQRIRSLNILNAVSNTSSVWLLIDYGFISQINELRNSEELTNFLDQLKPYSLAGISVISTSFPDSKPANGTSRSVTSLDVVAQSRIDMSGQSTPLIYGDYAATNPLGSMEYIPGMQIIPFANYYSQGEWWQTRRGADKEFSAYVDIARDITQLPGFHGAAFCWATQEIDRIATAAVGGNGNNGTWNGIRINQHICAMLDYLNSVGFPAIPHSNTPDSGEDEG